MKSCAVNLSPDYLQKSKKFLRSAQSNIYVINCHFSGDLLSWKQPQTVIVQLLGRKLSLPLFIGKYAPTQSLSCLSHSVSFSHKHLLIRWSNPGGGQIWFLPYMQIVPEVVCLSMWPRLESKSLAASSGFTIRKLVLSPCSRSESPGEL